jgi:hypothetical protein
MPVRPTRPTARGKVLVIIVKVVEGQRNLRQIVPAAYAVGRFPDTLNCWQK